ncbi:MAG: hypothetical protein CVV33_06725, partial [Methanomicrobiales archaeon HGW-Methanomicrobiales-4]
SSPLYHSNAMGMLKSFNWRLQLFYQYILSKFGVNIKLSKRVIDKIDQEVLAGAYSSRSELILEAVLKHLDRGAREDEIRSFLKSPEGRALIKEIQKEDPE